MSKILSVIVLALCDMMLFPAVGYAQRSRARVSAADVTGRFKMNFKGKFKEYANFLDILALGGGKLRVAFDLLYPYTLDNENGSMSAHLGSISG
jgi:hypothetical protein